MAADSVSDMFDRPMKHSAKFNAYRRTASFLLVAAAGSLLVAAAHISFRTYSPTVAPIVPDQKKNAEALTDTDPNHFLLIRNEIPGAQPVFSCPSSASNMWDFGGNSASQPATSLYDFDSPQPAQEPNWQPPRE